jgi:hypothetical protein
VVIDGELADRLRRHERSVALRRRTERPVRMTPAAPPASTRPLWLAVFLRAAAIGAAGLLAVAGGGGTNVPAAILTSGDEFAGAVAVLLALAHHLGGSPR